MNKLPKNLPDHFDALVRVVGVVAKRLKHPSDKALVQDLKQKLHDLGVAMVDHQKDQLAHQEKLFAALKDIVAKSKAA